MKAARTSPVVVMTLLFVLTVGMSAVRAAEVVVLCSNGYRAVMQDLAPQFERATSNRVAVTYDLSAALVRRIEAGGSFDVAILTPPLIDELVTGRFVRGASRMTLAVSPIGLAIRKGAAKPDLHSTEALRSTMLAATSMVYAKEGAAAGFFLALVQQLGLADVLKGRIVGSPSGAAVAASVASGQVMYVIPVSEILPVDGIDVGATFPVELGGYVTMTAGVSRTSNRAADDLVTFLTGPAAFPVLQARGMERR